VTALAVDPVQVAITAHRWDEQNLCLRAAHEALSATPAGFTPPVQAQAQAFLAAWLPVTWQLLVACDARADGLRTAARGITAADAGIAHRIRAQMADVLPGEQR
jgi:hypothetical protein